MDIKHILVTTDLSPEALRPCVPVAALARALGARVTLLHVIEGGPSGEIGPAGGQPVDLPTDLQARMILARTQLEMQCEAFEGLPVTVEVASGLEVVGTLIDYAESHDVDLIALSSHGRTGFKRLMLGSVAEALVRRSPVPVLVIPRPEDTRAQRSA